MSRLVSAEEARKLLDGARGPFSLWLPEPDGDWRIVAHDTPMKRRRVVAKCGYAKEEAAMLAAAPDLARTAIAIAEERDRLRDILAAERGERAPEGWGASRDVFVGLIWSKGHHEVRAEFPGRWRLFDVMGASIGDRHKGAYDYALEAIEAADRAAKESA